MSPTWTSDTAPDAWTLSLAGALRIALRGTVLFAVVFGGLLILLLVRLIERPFHGPHRPWTPHITVAVCRLSLWIIGLRVKTSGAPTRHHGAIVANHSTWLDIFVLNAAAPLYFVAKSEVALWPGIGWLARATGTVFVRRDRREAHVQKSEFEARLLDGHRLLFFPEGTSTDGQLVLPFKPTLFAAFFSEALREALWVQPVSVRYEPGEGALPRHYAWWGEMDFTPHLLKVLATPRHGVVHVVWHPALQVADFPDRKSLARAAESAVRDGHRAQID
ncbi:MAG: 1-acyl-sn-glycerol-3-phosphate acyltransferase [Silicimonas sp.]|nr:1-acyl-sn-glycerol-3-phosphate acyltransferase [Silicimonas sp.]